ncbi:hypothetical protein ACFLQ8_00125 [Candidatus Auribacterota bacterium]
MFKLFYALRDKWIESKPRRDYFFHLGKGRLYVSIASVFVIAAGIGIFYRIVVSDVSKYEKFSDKHRYHRSRDKITSKVSGKGSKSGDLSGLIKEKPVSSADAFGVEQYRDKVINFYKDRYGEGYKKEIKKDMLRDQRIMGAQEYKDEWHGLEDIKIELDDTADKEKLIEEIEKEGWE